MRVAKLVGSDKIIIEDVEKLRPGLSEVLINVKFCGICGSDIYAYLGKHPFIHPPIVLGHEFSGIISEVGEGVKDLVTGRKVVVEPLVTCGKCYSCRAGQYNRCSNIKVVGCQVDGAFSEYFVAPSHRVFTLPDDVSLEIGALIEPLAVSVHAVKRGKVERGHHVVVLGDGPVGILTALAAKKVAADVTIIGISDYKLDKALNCGVDYAVNVRNVDPVRYAKERFGHDGVDVVFECVGHTAQTVNQAIDMARRGARIVIVGVFDEDIPVKMGYVQDRELELLGSLTYTASDFQNAINYASSKEISLREIITKIFQLGEITHAFRFILENRDVALKVLVQVTQKSGRQVQSFLISPRIGVSSARIRHGFTL